LYTFGHSVRPSLQNFHHQKNPKPINTQNQNQYQYQYQQQKRTGWNCCMGDPIKTA